MNDPIKNFGFRPENYKLLFIGLGVNVVGFLLMIGGGSDDPNKFDSDALFSHLRITISPILITLGYAIMIYSIMKKPAVSASNNSNFEDAVVEEKSEQSISRKKKSMPKTKKGRR